MADSAARLLVRTPPAPPLSSRGIAGDVLRSRGEHRKGRRAGRSYLRSARRPLARLSELVQLYRFRREEARAGVHGLVEAARDIDESLARRLGKPVVSKDVLEVGTGQRRVQMRYFGRANRYVGIDLDSTERGLTPASVVRMLRASGATRTLKTVGRRVLGIDRMFEEALVEELGNARLDATILQMDASTLDFESKSFDCVISTSVFEHLEHPARAADEIARVLRPGGVAVVLTHVFTSNTGAHDPRSYGPHASLPQWAHLRPETAAAVEPNCYLNRLRLDPWRDLFSDAWPGVELECYESGDPNTRMELARARLNGELAAYADEELTTDMLAATWVKPR